MDALPPDVILVHVDTKGVYCQLLQELRLSDVTSYCNLLNGCAHAFT